MFKEMAKDEFKDFMAFILWEAPHLYYIGQVKHRKAIGLSGLKNEKTDFGTNIAARMCVGGGESKRGEKISARGSPEFYI